MSNPIFRKKSIEKVTSQEQINDYIRVSNPSVCTTLDVLRKENKKCGNCKYFELCNGGCRAIALALTGDKLGIDPSKCFFWENGYADKVAKALPDYRTNI